jgi:hypothetical protein
VAGIDGDDEVAGIRAGVRRLDRCIGARRAAQVDDQSITVLIVGRRHKALRVRRSRQIEDDAQITGWAAPHANLLDHTGSRRRARTAREAGSCQVEDDPIRICKHQQAVLGVTR